MDLEGLRGGAICRLCLYKCENPRNMLVDQNLAEIVTSVFPKIMICEENGLTNLVCEYCCNTVLQFNEFFETVNRNQEKLSDFAKYIPESKNEMEHVETQIDVKLLSYDSNNDNQNEDCFLESKIEITDYEFDNGTCMQESDHDEGSDEEEPPPKIDVNNLDISKLSYYDLINLPPNFTISYRCTLCVESKCYSSRKKVKWHILKEHYVALKTKSDNKVAEAETLSKKAIKTCNLCNKRISEPGSFEYRDHVFLHYNIRPYACELCDHTTISRDQMRKHQNRHSDRLYKIICPSCRAEFETEDEKDEHIKAHHPEEAFQCDLCGKSFTRHEDIEMHIKNHGTKTDLPFECERCPGGIRFPTEKVLELHRKRHIKEDKTKKKFSCKFCERTYNVQRIFDLHKTLHKKGDLSACVECGATISSETFRMHVKCHQERSVQCPTCNLVFERKQLLSYHIQKVHEKVEIPCHKCGKSFGKRTIASHIRFCGGPVVLCAHCPMTFAKKSDRQRHTRLMHSGWHCRRCNLTFETESQSNQHRKHDPYHLSIKQARKENRLKNKLLETL